ncbi:ABC transporter substrate-binding protein [soil metagenome]
MRTSRIWTASLLAAALTISSCGLGAKDSASDSGPATTVKPVTVDDLVAKSKSETKLLIYGNPDEQQWKPVIAAFEAKYPWIDVEALSLGGGETFQRYRSEEATGSDTADILVESDGAAWLDFAAAGQVLNYDEPALEDLPDYAELAPGIFAMSEDPLIALFNKELLPEDQQPTTLAGLAELSADFEGKIGTYEIENALGYMGTHAYIDEQGEEGWKVLEELGPNTKAEASAATVANKVAQGEYAASYFLSGALRKLATGDGSEVLNWRYLTDATSLVPRGIAVTKASNASNSARLFVNFVLSKAGQDATCEGGFTPYRTDVDCEFGLSSIEEAVGKDMVIIPTYDTSLLTDQEAFRSRWNEAFGR